jgi:hypothetical protein
MLVFWVVTCGLLGINQRFRKTYCLHLQGLCLLFQYCCNECSVHIVFCQRSGFILSYLWQDQFCLAIISFWSLVFRDVLPCSQTDVDRHLRGACCLHHQGDEWVLREKIAGYTYRSPVDRPPIPHWSAQSTGLLYNQLSFLTRLTIRHDDGGSTHLWNVGRHLFDYTAVHPWRLWTSYLAPWELEISYNQFLFIRANLALVFIPVLQNRRILS